MIVAVFAIFAMMFTWCLLFERAPLPFLILLCAALGVFLVLFGRHSHGQFLPVDVLAQGSKLKNINPMLKFWTVVVLIIICVGSRSCYTGIFLMTAMLMLVVLAGGLRVREYVHFLTLPMSFLLIAAIALLFEVSPEPTGVLNFPIFGIWFIVSVKSQVRTALIVSRAFGAVSCLCALSVTTPMPDITGVLRRARCPDLIIDLMYLIYRYLFILLSVHQDMHTAAGSRLGFRDYRTSIRSTGKIYSNLLVRGYQFAGKNFDAMESRCYDTGIRFLEHNNKVNFKQTSLAGSLICVSMCLALLPL